MNDIPTNVINFKNKNIRFINFLSKHKTIILTSILIFSYALFYFLVDFSSQSLVAHDEGLYARRSKLLEESNNWFSPPFLTPHHKTLGSYWFIALSIRLFGNSELALRLPSILCSFICLFITYSIAIKVSNKKSAFISVFSLSSMPLWIQYSRYSSPDVPFVMCILLVIFFFLEFLDNTQLIKKCLYIFISGLFISISFFIRSYMAFVPLIGLTPFFLYHLLRTKKNFIILFSAGIFLGSLPTFLNLYYSFNKYGITGITALFDFAKKQAISGHGFNNLFLIPFNYLYLTFPIGIILLILYLFTRTHNNVDYPLLIYFYPLLSLAILLCMSTSYPHYYLFLLPSLSILFSIHLQSDSFRFLISKVTIRYSLLIILLLLTCILLAFVFNYNNFLLEYSNGKTLLVYIVSIFWVLSFIYASRNLLDTRQFRFNLIKFFYNLIIPQYISLSLLYNFGVLGNPNFKTKSFLNEEVVSSIVNSNTIYLYHVDSKIQTLLSYYLPYSMIVDSSEFDMSYNYIITSDISFLNSNYTKNNFEYVGNFDNNFLLMKISK